MRTGTRPSTCVGLAFSIMLKHEGSSLKGGQTAISIPQMQSNLDIIPGDSSLVWNPPHSTRQMRFLTTKTTSLTNFLSFIFVMMSTFPCIVG